MTAEQSEIVTLIKQRVVMLNRSIEQFEQRLCIASQIARADYQAKTALESFLPLKWLRLLRTPQVRTMHNGWQQLNSTVELTQALKNRDFTWSVLASMLNIYVLTAVNEVIRLQANQEIIGQVNELATIAKAIAKQAPINQ